MADRKIDPVDFLVGWFGIGPNPAVARALDELRRRQRIERRRDNWLYEQEDALRAIQISAVSVKLTDYRASKEWFCVRAEHGGDVPADTDDWSATDVALNKAGAPEVSDD